ncbi:MAG: carboxylating nicotinate-nucleotide diphosphorylase [Pseudarcicella sp.]|nr:carboxylating nicotinate-nucleotide diphosphorylase [Pseudarcicella sp.]MBP6410543.1 carboxylating nicotinate-nucleotide diphosphorylase [Pseudarcicella sp.]
MFDYLQKDYIRQFIQSALTEDVGDGDHTSLATIPADAQGKARLLVKEQGLLAGVEMAGYIFNEVDPELKVDILINDGTWVQPQDIVLTVHGRSQSILRAERLVLNCMQRMSGIATFTNSMVQLLEGTSTQLLDTRKTTPNFRLCEKWACKIGGAVNHRYALFDMILIKDNHVDYAGGIKKAISQANDYLKKTGKNLQIEIEVRNLDELKEVLEMGEIHRIMLDNFNYENLKTAVNLIGNRYPTEASGGINASNMKEYAACGVDFISSGALTHHVKSIDLSLKAY